MLLFTTIKCAHLSKLSEQALEIAKVLFKKCFQHAIDTNQELKVAVFILQQLMLLRNEQNFKSPYDSVSCVFALSKALEECEHDNSKLIQLLSCFIQHSNECLIRNVL